MRSRSAHSPAVTAVSGGHSYAYDANGNLTSRTTGGQSFTLTYDAENRLAGVSGAATASFVYDGDGRRVKATVNGVTSYYVGDQYEVSGGVVKKYYTAGGRRIALRSGGTLYWLLNDLLGGTAVTVSGTAETGEVRYKAFGATRFTSGTTPTSVRFTGQREEASLGLYDYGARWYDPALGQFLSPDTIVPAAGNALDYHRYAYTRFNPVRYEDDSGHCATLANGQADENDADCWRLARTIGNLWNVTDYWRTRFGKLDVWNNHIAPSGVDAEFMQSELSTYLQSDAYLNWAEQHSPSPIPLERLQDPLCGGNHPCQTLAETADQLDAFCKANDCVGLGNDVVGVGAGLLVVGAPLCGPAAPGCVVAGTYVGGASTVFGSGWAVYNFVNNNAS